MLCFECKKEIDADSAICRYCGTEQPAKNLKTNPDQQQQSQTQVQPVRQTQFVQQAQQVQQTQVIRQQAQPYSVQQPQSQQPQPQQPQPQIPQPDFPQLTAQDKAALTAGPEAVPYVRFAIKNKQFKKLVRPVQRKIFKLQKIRKTAIENAAKARWRRVGGRLSFNSTEGKVIINDRIYPFSSVGEVDIVDNQAFRTVMRTDETVTGGSRKHISPVGAIAGAAVGGGVGAAVGGSVLGRSSKKEKIRSTTNTENIPTCLHLSVTVIVSGIKEEIVLISKETDLNSSEYRKAQSNAKEIALMLRAISETPMPDTFVPVVREPSVLQVDERIAAAQKELVDIFENPMKYLQDAKYMKKNRQKRKNSVRDVILYIAGGITIVAVCATLAKSLPACTFLGICAGVSLFRPIYDYIWETGEEEEQSEKKARIAVPAVLFSSLFIALAINAGTMAAA